MNRQATIHRQTSETDIQIELHLDGSGQHSISTGIGFLDHMLTAVAVHGLFDLTVKATGDLHIDSHHTIEDTAIVLGKVFDQALGDRKGINRVGHAYVPMDEALGFVALDISGRPHTIFHATWATPAIGQFPTNLVEHFFESFAVHSRITLHARVDGRNDHHKAEALFKALARALRTAVDFDPRRLDIASTKGTLIG
ncbi:MAG: imidazoleglycerol-phosphate dehydratase HisB [Chloroflexi bacterium]|nr:imidazoleglycerol-phosphate dehydratase HisB [Ardenticatenaceae bacterium]MBL1131354.1 imidazoleglycerol-phosphate dehydratase HisB [Chloroflexota bacterium]NOG37456.1 imidazoleglycerol-phosphate dehydratase HisB [Chloroflexota bacterium]